MIVRSQHIAFDVAETDAAIATVYYPADENKLSEARLTGAVPADLSLIPWPLVIVMPGINVAPDTYRWLASQLVASGYCAVTYTAIGSLGPAGRGITPGMDMSALAPDVVGTRLSATALLPLLEALRSIDGPAAGLIDLDRVAVGGHSAGGTVALHNTNPSWIPGLRCSFSFGGHTMTSRSLGHGDATVTKVPSLVPIMMLTGAHDGVVAASRDRYRSDDEEHDPVQRTFDEGIARNEGDCWMVELAEGNHFSICDPVDETAGRSFLEDDLRAGDIVTRQALGSALTTFLDAYCRGTAGPDDVEAVLSSAAISRWARR